MKRIRTVVRAQDTQWREVILRCPCTRVGVVIHRTDDLDVTLRDLHERHRLAAPDCPHRKETHR